MVECGVGAGALTLPDIAYINVHNYDVVTEIAIYS